MTAQQAFARVGDVIAVHAVSPAYINPLRVIRITLENPEQCAYANQLLSDPNSGWKLEQTALRPA